MPGKKMAIRLNTHHGKHVTCLELDRRIASGGCTAFAFRFRISQNYGCVRHQHRMRTSQQGGANQNCN
jgi:hypothetical protein